MFALDHFLPVAFHPERVTEYENLLLACATCNAMKRDRLLPYPLTVLLSPKVRVAEDGRIHTDDPEALELIKSLGLNSQSSIEFRAMWINVVSLAAKYDRELYRRLMGYPDDVPDLATLRPPQGNDRPEGLVKSAFAQRQRGELPVVY